jgi:hypothetical protein
MNPFQLGHLALELRDVAAQQRTVPPPGSQFIACEE